MVTKVTKTWGSKGMGAEVSVWMPNQTYSTLEILHGGRDIEDIHRSLDAAIRDIVRESFPTVNHPSKPIETTVWAYDDVTGEPVE